MQGPSSATGRTHAHRERAFTLVEILVVIVLVAVFMGLGILSIRSSKATGARMSSIAVAHAYADAVDRFAREHGGRYPTFGAATDWPAGTVAARNRGPVARELGPSGEYLRQPPEAVQDGTVLVNPRSRTKKAYIVYAATANGEGYTIDVHVPLRPVDNCSIVGGSATRGAMRTCSKR